MTAETPSQRNRQPGVPWRALEALPEGRLAHGMNIHTLLDAALGGFRGGPVRMAEGSASSGYIIPAANAATCLAQAKVLPKP